MKKRLSIISIFIVIGVSAQVAIGKDAVSSASVSLEFGNEYVNSPVSNTEPRGMVLPWVNGTSDTSPYITGYAGSEVVAEGTLVYDAAAKKVKVKYATGWKDLSIDNSGVVDTTLQDSLSDSATSKAMIGGDATTDTTSGILVLADTDKAMVLPKVASPHLNIVNPTAGMVVYDTVRKQLAVYNGTVWTFWKP